MSQAIKDDTEVIRDDTARILDEIAEIRAALRLHGPRRSAEEPGSGPGPPDTDMINRYLDSLTTYAETVADWATVRGEDDQRSEVSIPASDEGDGKARG